MGPPHGQAEDIGRHLDDRVAPRSATGGPDLGELNLVLRLGQRPALLEGEHQSLEDGAIDVGPGVDVAESEDRSLRRRVQLRAGRPEGLANEAHRARRNIPDQLLQQFLGRGIGSFGHLPLAQAELLLEPRNQPEAAEDRDLRVELARDRRRIRRQEGAQLNVLRDLGVERGGCPEADAGLLRRQAARADHIAGLVVRTGDHRQTSRDPALLGRAGRHVAEQPGRRNHFGQLVRLDREEGPLQVSARRPGSFLHVERDGAEHVAAGVPKLAGEPVAQVARQE